MKGPLGWMWDQLRYQGPGHQRRVEKRLAKRDRERYAPGRLPVDERSPAESRR